MQPFLPAKLTKYRVDKAYCNGPASKPVPKQNFGKLAYTNSAANPPATVNIKSWISGIGEGSPFPDELSKFDESIDSSIGGLGDKMEKMYNSQRSVPLFEFRDLFTLTTEPVTGHRGIEDFMTEVDSTIQDLHKRFADPPKKRKRNVAANCTMPSAPAQSSFTNPTSAKPTSTRPTSIKPTSDKQTTAKPTSANPTSNTPTSDKPTSSKPTSANSTSVKPTSTVVAPVDPPSQPTCVPTPTSKVKDSHEGELEKAAKYFCDEYASNTNAKGPINIAQTIIAGDRDGVDSAYPYPPEMGNQDDVYDITLTSVPNCTPSGGFNLATPVANNQCTDILHSAWKQCETPSFPNYSLSTMSSQ